MMKTVFTRARPVLLLVLAWFVLAGATQALAVERKLTFAVSGVVQSLKVKPGDAVKAGTILAVLDQTPFQARKQAADARASSARLIFEQTQVKRDQVRELYESLSASQEDVDKAEVAHANAKADFEVAQSKADISAWRLRRASLTSPFSGTVTAVPGYPGMVLNTYAGGQTVVIVNAP